MTRPSQNVPYVDIFKWIPAIPFLGRDGSSLIPRWNPAQCTGLTWRTLWKVTSKSVVIDVTVTKENAGPASRSHAVEAIWEISAMSQQAAALQNYNNELVNCKSSCSWSAPLAAVWRNSFKMNECPFFFPLLKITCIHTFSNLGTAKDWQPSWSC